MQDLGSPPKEVMGDMPEGFVSFAFRFLSSSFPFPYAPFLVILKSTLFSISLPSSS